MGTLVTISREYGSGGGVIGKMLAERLGLPLFDKEIIDKAVEKSGLSREVVETAELRAKSAFTYSFASAMTFSEGFTTDPISVNDRIFLAQFDIIRQIGETGNGVIIGRCADYVLKDVKEVTNIFIHGEYEDRIKRCISQYGVPQEKARGEVKKHDKARRNYYNYHTSQKWGEYENYNFAINTSYITDENAADLIVMYLKNRKHYKEK